MTQPANRDVQGVGHTAGPLIATYGAETLSLHRADSLAECTAKTRIMKMKRTPENIAFVRSIVAHANMLAALKGAEQIISVCDGDWKKPLAQIRALLAQATGGE